MRFVRDLGPTATSSLAGVCVLIIWSALHGGYAPTTWYPGALFLIALLAVVLAALRRPPGGLARELRLAIACFAGFTAWSYLSILWAGDRGEAWDGANRTLLYLIIFVLFATHRVRTRTGALIIAAWTVGVAVIALVIVVELNSAARPLQMFVENRLADPTGYPNATAALWLSAVLPAVLLSARGEVPWPWRGALAAVAVVFCDAALLTQSRGGVYSLAIVAIATIAVARDRVRLVASLAPVAVAVGVTAPALVDLPSRLQFQAPAAAVHAVTLPILPAAAAVGLIVALVGVVERYRPPGVRTRNVLRVMIARLSVALALAAVVGAVIVIGNPITRARAAWRSFEHPTASANLNRGAQGVRLSSGLSGERYDYYRVALNIFSDHPLAGIGADNFAQQYLRQGRTGTTPKYPHSIEMRTLAQTGLVGAGLLLLAFLFAARCAIRAVRRDAGLRGAVAMAALLVWVYWIVHGSVDWLWEFPALGGAAMAMLGLACACAPKASAANRRQSADLVSAASRNRKRGLTAVAGLAWLAGTASLGAPWLAERNISSAEARWRSQPASAFRLLDSAAGLNPLSPHALLVRGTIALRLGHSALAVRAFEGALARDHDEAYATLELGAIASAAGRLEQARRLIARAHVLDPYDPVTRAALASVTASERVDVSAMNQNLAFEADALIPSGPR